ncbi:hypothetical protein [Vibrio sp. SCSIO 43097]|uniref:hypothetical protein n=1 Tax=Vibrio sp. SCSIO 43097 TaxID=2819104 RepID=UPI00202B833E|nr:hypothetical protein [Vibrio sp. SCSIO 43097]URQ95551.1 hypothetical protein J4N40_07280 [Vibrio sp. SCSIO 43097]
MFGCLAFWLFGLINAGWIVFAFLFKLWHERQLKRLEQDLRFDAERRLKVFDLKATEYANYVASLDQFGSVWISLDQFGKKNQSEIMGRMQPIFDQYLNNFMAASAENNQEKTREVLVWFSQQISLIMHEGGEDFFKLKSESNRLKLIATDEMLGTFQQLEDLTELSMNTAHEFMGKLTEIVLHQQTSIQEEYLAKLNDISSDIQVQSKLLMTQMRTEIRRI